MRLTGIIWTCPHCRKEFELFTDDGANDSTCCWNWCPYCGLKVDVWFRFKSPNEQIAVGISCEQAHKMLHERSVNRLKVEDPLRYRDWVKLKSKCLPFRLKHLFRSPNTRSAPRADERCFKCGKTLRQIRAERKNK